MIIQFLLSVNTNKLIPQPGGGNCYDFLLPRLTQSESTPRILQKKHLVQVQVITAQRNSEGFIQFFCGPLVKLTLLNLQWSQSKLEAYSFFIKLICFLLAVSILSTSLKARIPAYEMIQ